MKLTFLARNHSLMDEASKILHVSRMNEKIRQTSEKFLNFDMLTAFFYNIIKGHYDIVENNCKSHLTFTILIPSIISNENQMIRMAKLIVSAQKMTIMPGNASFLTEMSWDLFNIFNSK
jgi:hypothetical protein